MSTGTSKVYIAPACSHCKRCKHAKHAKHDKLRARHLPHRLPDIICSVGSRDVSAEIFLQPCLLSK